MQAEIRSLTETLFGAAPPTAAETLSARDAIHCVARLTAPAEALDLLRLAMVSGDETLARAVAARAYEVARVDQAGDRDGWEHVLAIWADHAADPDVAELAAPGTRR